MNGEEFIDREGVKVIAQKVMEVRKVIDAENTLSFGHTYDFTADSISEGLNSKEGLNFANGVRSHAEGIGTVAKNKAEHSEGIYNVSNEGTIHSIGIGERGYRRNAFEVTKDGDIYAFGIGGYDGTNINDVETLQNYIKKLEDRIQVLENELINNKK